MGHFWMETTEKEWLNKFFSIGNREIDGRPLYKYRLTSAEYENLRQVLAGRCSGPDSLDDLLSDFGFRMLFVFFATEWYKREYSGGTWRWEDIFSRFTRKTVRNVANRSNAVREGFKSLKIEIPEEGAGKRFFGAVITNGGLPAKYIQNNRSPLGIVGLITATLKYKLKYCVSSDELYDYIEDRAIGYNFPDSLRNENMYLLIVDVVEKVVELKSRYNINSKIGAITKLDNANPEWREEFPILLEDEAIRTLLNSLMQDASEVKVAQKRPFVRRFLNGNQEDLFLDAEIVFPSKPIENDYFTRYFAMGEDLPNVFYLNTWDDSKTRIAKIEVDFFKSDVYTISSYGNKLPATESIVLETYSPTNEKNINGFKLRLAEGIDLEDPLVFIADEKGNFVYVGSGDVGVADSVCWIGLPANAIVSEGLEYENSFKVSDKIFNLYKCEKSNVIINGCEIRLNDTTRAKQYVLGGRLLQYRTKPYDAYLGLPQLYYMDEEQNYIKEQNVVYRKHRSEEVVEITYACGLVDVCCIKNDRVICRLPVFTLPQESLFKYDNVTSTGGSICLEIAGSVELIPVNNPEYSAVVSGNTIDFQSLTAIPPAVAAFCLVFPNGMGRMDVEMPFPAKGFGFYDENQTSINNSVISLNNLYGKRINVFGLDHKCFVSFSSGVTRIGRDLLTKNSFAESRLIDYENDIRFLFGNSNEDITLSIEDAFSRPVRLYVSKYDMIAEIHDGNAFIVCQTEAKAENAILYAIDILGNNVKPVQLSITLEGVVDTSKLGSGCYIVYSSEGSDFSLRPFVYRKDIIVRLGDFYRCIVFGDNQGLINILRDELAADYDSILWNEIDKLSKLFIDNKIPLDALNLWSCIAKVPKFLAAYILRGMFAKPCFNKELSLQDAIRMADILVDTQYDCAASMLYKLRNELLVNLALLPKDILSDAVFRYRHFFDKFLDDMFIEYVHSGYNQELWYYMTEKFRPSFVDLKNKIWDKQYTIVATVFKEISFVLCTFMYFDLKKSPSDFMKKIQSIDSTQNLLRMNLFDWSNDDNGAEAWGDKLFNELSKMLNPYISPDTDEVIGMAIPHTVCEEFISKCKCENTCRAPLFRFERYPESRSYVIHFPMFCAWLANQGQDAYLQNQELLQTVKNFIRFHISYFTEAYRISTIILSKV